MKDQSDLVAGLVRKAESDLLAMNASLNAGALDAACFHAQQAAEKYLKSFLASKDIAFPHTHNVSKLLEACATVDPSLRELLETAATLTPYAVELRYDFEFWPSKEAAQEARTAAIAVRDAIAAKLA
jgi:HEPN domain-containing protein